MAIFGRLGSRPFTREEMERLFMTRAGQPWRVTDDVDMSRWVGTDNPWKQQQRNADAGEATESVAMGGQ